MCSQQQIASRPQIKTMPKAQLLLEVLLREKEREVEREREGDCERHVLWPRLLSIMKSVVINLSLMKIINFAASKRKGDRRRRGGREVERLGDRGIERERVRERRVIT